MNDEATQKKTTGPGKFSLKIKLIVFIAFTVATAGWLVEVQFPQFKYGILISRYTEYFIIIGFAFWRIRYEKDPYVKRRLTILALMILIIWTIIPNFRIPEPLVTHVPGNPVFPSIHVAGTLTFFLVLIAVFLFGRRFICGWCCPCAGLREIVAFPFRSDTVRGETAWKFRYTKWIFFVLYMIFLVLTFFPINKSSSMYYGLFAGLIGIIYYGALFVSPVLGNRNYCRFFCPFGATFGLLNKAGFYGINHDSATCKDCKICNKVCDMGIPVMETGKKYGKVNVADCIGCGRCVISCQTGSLSFHDIRDAISPGKLRNRDFLLQNKTLVPRKAAFIMFLTVGLMLLFIISCYVRAQY